MYILKIFANFVDLSCIVFWTQNVPIPPDKNWSILLDQSMLIFLVNNACNGNMQIFWYKKLCKKT